MANPETFHAHSFHACAKCRAQRALFRCDCGGPESGTAHAPDCALPLNIENLQEDHDDALSDPD